jgi:hypothetical protein
MWKIYDEIVRKYDKSFIERILKKRIDALTFLEFVQLVRKIIFIIAKIV